jgi:aminoglycoside phosphotransferase family enzyme/predicted kinase
MSPKKLSRHSVKNADNMTAWTDLIEKLRSTLACTNEAPIEVVQTHISVVLLGRTIALKLKKPLDFGFLNYTTLEKRRMACEAEVVLNRRLCPDVYLGVQPVVEREGVVHLGGAGEVLDYAVLMRRLPQARMLDSMVQNGSVTETIVARVAHKLAEFHRHARRGPEINEFGSSKVLARNWQENFEQVAPFVDETISGEKLEAIRQWVEHWIDKNLSMLQERIDAGHICDGHGDVRCESICIRDETEDGLCLFDCIEFNERFRYGDVVGEVAFLASDLDAYGRPDLGYLFAEQYSAFSGDEQLFSLLPFYRCYRAFVRGKVLSFRLAEPEFSKMEKHEAAMRARTYFDWASRYATPLCAPTVIAVTGLSGSGKTTLARAIAGELGLRVVSSDALRAEIFGVEKKASPYGRNCYSDEANLRVYKRMLDRAQEYLRAGNGVVLDATFLRTADREAARRMARAERAAWRLIVCTASTEIVRTRLARRARLHERHSDADWSTYLQQRDRFKPPNSTTNGECDGCRLVLRTDNDVATISRAAAHWLRAGQASSP